jgi:broad specificity phosphatase PhoE
MALVTTLVLARHGETVWHAENRYAGSSDVALTDLGRRQAQELGRWAGVSNIAAVYSSDLSRAVLTAEPASMVLGLSTVIDPRLREVHFGAAEGMTTSEMEDSFPDDLRRFRTRPASSPLPGAENGRAAVRRAWNALEEIAAKHDATVLVVMHSTLMRLVLCHATGLPLDGYRSVFPNVLNVAATTLELRAGYPTALLGYNVPTLPQFAV